MKKIITGLKPTGSGLHIGNYLGAFKPFLDISKDKESYIFIADYHSLTSVHNGNTLRSNKENMLLEYFALIPDDSNVIVFEQSKVRRINDITWLISSMTPYSMMLRAHAFKDSQNKNKEVNMALFNYPVLMTSDIITYDIDLVPVGKDQKQHIEFARDIAGYFNRNYNSEVFKLPEEYIQEEVKTIPGIDGRKMSKSYNNFIPLFATKAELKKLIMAIKTDDKGLEEPKNPDTCNVFALIKFFGTPEQIEEIRQKYLAGNYGYGHAKLELLDILDAYVAPFRERKEFLRNNPEIIKQKLEYGNKKANEMADKKYAQLMKIVGLDK
ncbi:MAG: tryptophan--tRNA ligase [Candidatus Gracilibacteria bacterium]|nr:tryptophan--tRNA ligase [Candidatus Gracilibacteria bacterium]